MKNPQLQYQTHTLKANTRFGYLRFLYPTLYAAK